MLTIWMPQQSCREDRIVSEWRLRQPEDKKSDSLIGKIVLYVCLILVLAGIGGTVGALYHPTLGGGRYRLSKAMLTDTKPKMNRRFKIGAAAGGILGLGASVVFTIKASRAQRGNEDDENV